MFCCYVWGKFGSNNDFQLFILSHYSSSASFYRKKQVSTCYDMIRSRISCVTHFEKNTNFPHTYCSVFDTTFYLTVINHSQYVLLPAEYSPQVSTIIIFVSHALLPNMKGNNMLCSMCTFLGSSFYCFSKNRNKYWTSGTHNWYCTVYSVSQFRKTKFWTHEILMKNNPAQRHNSRRLVYVVDLSFIAYQSSYMNL